MEKLTQGIGEDDLAWYNDPKNSRSKILFSANN